MRATTCQNAKLSKVALYDRMFRVKPYTKCVQCITQDRLRCQKCMESIINKIAQKNDQNKEIESHKKLNENIPHTSDGSTKRITRKSNNGWVRMKIKNKENSNKICIISKYDWWMNEKKKKRENPNYSLTLTDGWPKKAKNHDYSLENIGAGQPRFERWEKKLLDQLLSKTNQL